jgi:hypothetical protein
MWGARLRREGAGIKCRQPGFAHAPSLAAIPSFFFCFSFFLYFWFLYMYYSSTLLLYQSWTYCQSVVVRIRYTSDVSATDRSGFLLAAQKRAEIREKRLIFLNSESIHLKGAGQLMPRKREGYIARFFSGFFVGYLTSPITSA